MSAKLYWGRVRATQLEILRDSGGCEWVRRDSAVATPVQIREHLKWCRECLTAQVYIKTLPTDGGGKGGLLRVMDAEGAARAIVEKLAIAATPAEAEAQRQADEEDRQRALDAEMASQIKVQVVKQAIQSGVSIKK